MSVRFLRRLVGAKDSMLFSDLHLIPALLKAVAEQGYTTPTPIQVQAIPHVLSGADLLGCAQTGTGKTAAFALPILQRLSGQTLGAGVRPIRVLVLAPTRELALQIHECFAAYGAHTGIRSAVIFGGVGQEPQVQTLRRGIDVLVATPGRLIDLMGQGYVRLGQVQTLVLDEADRMLDMGFVRDVRRVVAAVPAVRQTLLFSATMAPEVESLARELLHQPVSVSITPAATTVERIEQSVYFVEKGDKRFLLEHVLTDKAITRVIVFTRTKHGANKVVQHLDKAGVRAEAIHGNKSQGARVRALEGFRSGATRVLVATDIAARGLDIDNVSHVINFDLPEVPDSYVHRIGRTARAGADGIALSFCDHEERQLLADVERTIRKRIAVVNEHPFRAAHSAAVTASRPAPPPQRTGGRPPQRQGQAPRSGQPSQRSGYGSQGPAQGRGPSSPAQAQGPYASPPAPSRTRNPDRRPI
jgi:ATP-dependent RNA helicase RhlE